MFVFDHWHNRFSLNTLGYRLRSMPMLVILLPFVLGVLLADSFALPLMVVVALFVVALLALGLMTSSRYAMFYAAIALVMLGWIASDIGANSSAVPYDRSIEMEVVVDGIPMSRDGYRSADGEVVGWHDGATWRSAGERVRLWIDAPEVEHGDHVRLYTELRPRISRFGNYDELLYRRGYAGAIAVEEYNIIEVQHYRASGVQNRAIEKLSRYERDSVAHATVVAMVAGSRHAMPAELSGAYARTGLAHLMAVSGLHLGIVLMVLNVLLLPLRMVRAGHRIINLITIVALWLFVAVSGASASVIRAALMFSVLQVALFSSRRYNSLNALAFTLFAMLLYHSDYLYDISFQLSAVAVVGIVVWGVPIMRSVRIKRGVVSLLFSTIVIGLVATLWTLPITSYTFGYIAFVGILATPIVMLFSYVVVAMGLVTLLLPYPIALPFARLGEWAAALQNGIVEYVASWSFTGVEYRMSGVEVMLYYLLFTVITLMIWSVNRKKVVTLSYDDLG